MLPQTKNRYWPFLDENQRRLWTEAEAKGEAKGKAEAVLRILARRQIAVTDAQRERILACSDSEALDRWLDLAVTVTAVDHLFA